MKGRDSATVRPCRFRTQTYCFLMQDASVTLTNPPTRVAFVPRAAAATPTTDDLLLHRPDKFPAAAEQPSERLPVAAAAAEARSPRMLDRRAKRRCAASVTDAVARVRAAEES
eukprot:SAG31_NODE_19985_length_587_cov_0.600410_1_plen_112_part_10